MHSDIDESPVSPVILCVLCGQSLWLPRRTRRRDGPSRNI